MAARRGAGPLRASRRSLRGKAGRTNATAFSVPGPNPLGKLHQCRPHPPELAPHPSAGTADRLCRRPRARAPGRNESQLAVLGHRGTDLSRLPGGAQSAAQSHQVIAGYCDQVTAISPSGMRPFLIQMVNNVFANDVDRRPQIVIGTPVTGWHPECSDLVLESVDPL